MDKTGAYIEKRPRIEYMDIKPIDKKDDLDIFDN